jgi:hypothetical protein
MLRGVTVRVPTHTLSQAQTKNNPPQASWLLVGEGADRLSAQA